MTRSPSQREALTLDLEAKRMAKRANAAANHHSEPRFNDVAIGLRAIRRELRALMHDDDRSGT